MRIGPSAGRALSPQRDPFKLDRRAEERAAHAGRMVASYSDGATRSGITYLELVDQSSRGLGARSRVPIDPGMRVTICPEGSTIPWLGARAARCEREGGGWWRVGLVMDSRVAA